MANCDVVKIDSNVTGLRYAQEECPKILPPATAAVKASGLLSFSAQVLDNETITIGATTYTYQDILSTGPTLANEILIGATVSDTVANTIAAINAGAGVGVKYSTGTVANASVTAAQGIGNSVAVTAKVAGVGGNSVVTTDTTTSANFGGGTLTGGADANPGTVTWTPLEPNSYSSFGGQVTTVSRDPINPTRQRYKGNVTDLAADGGINVDMTATNLQDLLQGFMFAAVRKKGSDLDADYVKLGAAGDLEISANPGAAYPQLTSTTADFTTWGLIPGEWIYIGGDTAGKQFDTIENCGFKRISSISAHAISLDKSVAPMVTDAGAGKTIEVHLGRVLKNESGSDIISITYQLERTLGSLDGMDPPQSEYLVGACPNEFTLNLSTAQKVTADLTFVGLDFEQRTQAEGTKPGTRPTLSSESFFNSSSDVKRVKLSYYDPDSEAPTPMFAFLQEGKLTINNNIKPLKSIGTLGAIGTSAGTFTVSGTLTAYFSDIAAVKAVRNNADVSLDAILVKEVQGGSVATIFDMPLLTLGDGRPNVTKDEPITLPLSLDANSGSTIDPAKDYTLLWMFFNKLPELALTTI